MFDQDKMRSAVAEILEAIGEDPSREGLKDTPRRVAQMYEELFWGLEVEPESALDTIFEEDDPQDQMVVLRDVSFYSICEHHLLPFYGRAHIGYIPHGRIAGASKLARALEVVARRPQLQERITARLADAIQGVLKPDGTGVVIEAEHLCMTMRGVKKEGSVIVTSASRGAFAHGGISKGELMAALRSSRGSLS